MAHRFPSRRSFNPLRSFRFAWARIRGRAALRLSGAAIGAHVDAIGAPVLTLHPNSTVSLGDGVRLISKSFATALGVHHPVVIRTLAEHAVIRIESGVGISGGSICAAQSVTIGADTLLGANVTIADTDFHSLHVAHRGSGHQHVTVGAAPVRIGRNVFIGTGTIVLKGVSIGSFSVIGAGSVVTSSIPEKCIAAGNPCRVIRTLTDAELGQAETDSTL